MLRPLRNKRSIFVLIFFHVFFLVLSRGTEQQCQLDCQSSISRLVGPTRPWHKNDELGNSLSLTRPYPYIIAASDVLAIEFNITLRLQSQQWLSTTPLSVQSNHSTLLSRAEKLIIVKAAKSAIANFSSYKVNIVSEREIPIVNATSHDTNRYERSIDVTLKFVVIASHNGYNSTSADRFYTSLLWPTIRNYIETGNFSRSVEEKTPSKSHLTTLTTHFPSTLFEATPIPAHRTFLIMHTDKSKSYYKFCEVGCTLFFSSISDPMHLSECTHKCDQIYQYNITVGYNDLMEVSRLECRDGCQMALKRCQPGYFCSQVSLLNDDENSTLGPKSHGRDTRYTGGYMSHCPAGKYRDFSFDAIEMCVDCPPGRFREDTKGKSLDSCTKCPIGTYVNSSGSTSIRDCLRCPAGYFASESGSAFCKCITPDSCKKEQLPSPANSEKRETIPYIGRW